MIENVKFSSFHVVLFAFLEKFISLHNLILAESPTWGKARVGDIYIMA